MLCRECGTKLVPRKDVVCPSGTDTCSAPSWYCEICYNVRYIHSEKEFDNWIEQFILLEEEDFDDKFSVFDLDAEDYNSDEEFNTYIGS